MYWYLDCVFAKFAGGATTIARLGERPVGFIKSLEIHTPEDVAQQLVGAPPAKFSIALGPPSNLLRPFLLQL